MLRSTVLAALVCAAIACLAFTVSGSSRDQVKLALIVTDQASGEPMRARVSIVDCNGEARCPVPADSCLFHDSSWAHRGYFYADGACTLLLDPGCTLVGVGAGFEYRPISDTLEVSVDTSLNYELERCCDMRAIGWHCGDVHSHMCHPGGVYEIGCCSMVCLGEAEGLGVVNVLDNTHGFAGGVLPESSEKCLVYITEEQRSSVLGHTGFLGLSELIEPFNSGWAPLISDAALLVHAQAGGRTVCAHPVSTDDFFDLDSGPSATMLARELPVGLVNGAYDAFEILSYSNCHCEGRELPLWYRILNCGFALPACGGTDACVNRLTDRPLGGYRTYAECGAELDFDSWLSAVATGRSFVTNGPLFTAFSVEGASASETLAFAADESQELNVLFGVTSALPVSRADVIVNGERFASVLFDPAVTTMSESVTVTVDESCWVAARVFGEVDDWFTMGDSLFAHTNPVYVELGGRRILETGDAEVFVDWLDDLRVLGETRGEWDAPADSLRFFGAVVRAREYFEALAQGVATDVAGAQAPGVRGAVCISPNPCRDGAVIGSRRGGAEVRSATVYSLDGRFVRRLAGTTCSAEGSLRWDCSDEGGRRVASGVYMCRARLTDGSLASGKVVVLR